MRSILEKALVALLNEDKDQAEALFHDFILERSRQIHESLRQGEDIILDESWEQELSIDEMFTEDDLMGNDDVMEADDEEDQDAEDEADDTDAEEGDDETIDDEAAEDEDVMDDEPESIEDRVESLEDELTRLAAEFDAMMGGDEADLDSMSSDVDMDMDDDAMGEGDLTITQHEGGDLDMHHNAGMEDGSDEEDAFESLGESAFDNFTEVKVDHAEGKTTSSDKVTVDTKARGLQPKIGDRAFKGEPVEIKAKEHNGYDREAAPKTAQIEKRQNIKSKAEDGRSTVSKEGDKSALLNTGKEDKSAPKGLFSKNMVK